MKNVFYYFICSVPIFQCLIRLFGHNPFQCEKSMGAYGLLYTNLRYTPEGQRCEENGVETIGVSYPPGRVS